MTKEARRLDILRFSGKSVTRQSDLIVKETPVTIFVDGDELVTLLCSPKDLDYLAVGFLFGEGLITRRKDIKTVFADEKEGAVWVETTRSRRSKSKTTSRRSITTGCGKGLTFADSKVLGKELRNKADTRVSVAVIKSRMNELQSRSQTFKRTGGVHSAGLATNRGIVAFNEDIGRHNAIDKVIGERILRSGKTSRLILMTSGRVSSDVLVKAARARIPIVVSKSAPTDMAIRFARDLGITLVGFARGSRMNVYANDQRILFKT